MHFFFEKRYFSILLFSIICQQKIYFRRIWLIKWLNNNFLFAFFLIWIFPLNIREKLGLHIQWGMWIKRLFFISVPILVLVFFVGTGLGLFYFASVLDSDLPRLTVKRLCGTALPKDIQKTMARNPSKYTSKLKWR